MTVSHIAYRLRKKEKRKTPVRSLKFPIATTSKLHLHLVNEVVSVPKQSSIKSIAVNVAL